MAMRLRRWVVATLVGAAFAGAICVSGVAARDDPCRPDYWEPFEPWSDSGQYSLMPNGALESSTGWQLSGGARLVSSNEPFHVVSNKDTRSLLLPSGSSAATPALCEELFQPTLRMFARNSGSQAATLRVEVTTNVLGVTRTQSLGMLSAAGDWQPTALLVSPQLPSPGVGTVSFRFTVIGMGSGWQIDDVFVDYPLKGN